MIFDENIEYKTFQRHLSYLVSLSGFKKAADRGLPVIDEAYPPLNATVNKVSALFCRSSYVPHLQHRKVADLLTAIYFEDKLIFKFLFSITLFFFSINKCNFDSPILF